MSNVHEKLLAVYSELSSWPKTTLKSGVSLKLGRIESNYNKSIEANCNYILSRSNYKVFKALNYYMRRGTQNEEQSGPGFIEII